MAKPVAPGPIRRWTAAEEDELERRWRAGERLEAIAAKLDRSIFAVHRKLRQMNLPGRRPSWTSWSETEIERLKKLRKQGLTIREIADRMPGRTAIAINRMRERIRNQAPKGKPPPQRKYTTQVTVWLTEQQNAAVQHAADHRNVSRAEVIRTLLFEDNRFDEALRYTSQSGRAHRSDPRG